jgi:CRP-like cAMP-binding protein|tara:strand:- start:4302 stop:4997 length:696 start_codon:yes stop_codon:yes gene_type:complete
MRIAGPARRLQSDVEIVSPGAPASHLHVLVEGWAYRARVTETGGQSISALFLPGDIVNLPALLSGEGEDCVTTLVPSRIMSLPLKRVRALQEEMPGITNLFLSLAMVENARLCEWIKCLGRQSATQRLAHLFCELAVRLRATVENSETQIPLPLTQVQLSDIIGMTHIHTSRVLSDLRKTGLVEISHRRLIIRNMAELQRIGEFNAAYLHDRENADVESIERGGRPSLPSK